MNSYMGLYVRFNTGGVAPRPYLYVTKTINSVTELNQVVPAGVELSKYMFPTLASKTSCHKLLAVTKAILYFDRSLGSSCWKMARHIVSS